MQNDLSEGPTLDVLIEQRTVVIPDLSAETRWPRFVAAATTRGVQCMAAFRLFVTQGNVGVLTLYGPRPHLFDDDAVLHGEILAQHAAVALAGAHAQEQLHRAIASRDVIGQAKGIIMERFGVTAVRAFEMLTQLSQERNVKLVNVAQQVVDTTGAA
ncbi:MAG: GAF and ANTAR domain-containing protein [Mycobacterium kyogaense]|uniref:GAF and ANTAR domain-containing protein n=1 Tax=Mycobacterium kyogaense TaxID=2212479 RepID=UPI002FF77C4A